MSKTSKLIWLIFFLLSLFTNFDIPIPISEQIQPFMSNFIKIKSKSSTPKKEENNEQMQYYEITKKFQERFAKKGLTQYEIVDMLELIINIDGVFQQLDVNKDNVLSFNEWCLVRLVVDEESMVRFREFDSNGNRLLDSEEFFVEHLEDQLKDMVPYKFQSIDKMPADGQISLFEFVKLQSFGQRPLEQIKAAFSTFDRNRNGQLDPGEFAIFYAHRILNQALQLGIINPDEPLHLQILDAI